MNRPALWVGLIFAVLIAGADAAPASCAPCHRAETAHFAESAMTHALAIAKDSMVLKANPRLAARIGDYSYEIADAVLTVTNGRDTMRAPIEWAFGQGTVGQTFLFLREGRWYESRVSYYATLPGLDITMGQQQPHDLGEALGRATGPAEARQCFDCHATNTGKSADDLSAMIAGVQCERCHGSTTAHPRAGAPMKKLGALNAEEMSDFCGQCHRTWSQIAASGPRGIQNIRFQPYRLANSKCFDATDRRIRCTACHDPHGALQTSAAAYDAKCTSCHTGRARRCSVATKDCVTCHMPKLELPGAHRKFTDHRIRIARAGEPYPD